MKVVRAEAMGICFGVRDALAVTASVADPSSVTIHGELVHNPEVLVQLQTRGFRMVSEDSRGRSAETPRVLITAHGISDRERRRLEADGKDVIDTTCPLVTRVHRAAQALAAEGYHVLVIGRPGHVEVRGIVDDLDRSDVVPGPDAVRPYPHERLGVVCQTTTPPTLAEEIRARIQALNPHAEIRYVDTICQPTRDRQLAVERLLEAVDAMVVVGGRNSNNTLQLVERCRERGLPAFHVQSAADLEPARFRSYRAVGLTAGTSTLDSTIRDVYEALCAM